MGRRARTPAAAARTPARPPGRGDNRESRAAGPERAGPGGRSLGSRAAENRGHGGAVATSPPARLADRAGRWARAPHTKRWRSPGPGRLGGEARGAPGGPATDTRGRRRRRLGRTLTMKSRAKLSSPLWSGLFMACTRWMNLLRISTCSILPPPSPRRPPARRSARSVFPSSLRPGPPSPPPSPPARPPRRGGCGCGGTGRASPRNLKERRGFPRSQASRGLAPAPAPSRPHPPSPPSSVRAAAAASGTRLSARPAPFPVLPFSPPPPARSRSRSRLSPRARPRRHPDARARAAAPPHERRTRRRLSPAGPAPARSEWLGAASGAGRVPPALCGELGFRLGRRRLGAGPSRLGQTVNFRRDLRVPRLRPPGREGDSQSASALAPDSRRPGLPRPRLPGVPGAGWTEGCWEL